MAEERCTVCGYEYSRAQHLSCPNCAAARVAGGISRKPPKPVRSSPLLSELAAALQSPVPPPHDEPGGT